MTKFRLREKFTSEIVYWRKYPNLRYKAFLMQSLLCSGCLHNLVSLNLNHNCLESLPGDIHYLTQLQFLSVSSNLLPLLPGELCSLRHLLELHLDGNHLSSLPTHIGKLTRLRKMMLQKNELNSLPSVSLTIQGTCIQSSCYYQIHNIVGT